MNVWRWMDKYLETVLTLFLLTIMVGVTCLQLFVRIFFESYFLWSEPLLYHVFLCLVFVTGSMGIRRGWHIRIRILERMMPRRMENGILFFIHFVGFVFCIGMVKVSLFHLSFYGAYIILLVGFSLMAFRFWQQMIKRMPRGKR